MIAAVEWRSVERVGDEDDLVLVHTDSRGSNDEVQRTALEGHCDVPDTVIPTDTNAAHNMAQDPNTRSRNWLQKSTPDSSDSFSCRCTTSNVVFTDRQRS